MDFEILTKRLFFAAGLSLGSSTSSTLPRSLIDTRRGCSSVRSRFVLFEGCTGFTFIWTFEGCGTLIAAAASFKSSSSSSARFRAMFACRSSSLHVTVSISTPW